MANKKGVGENASKASDKKELSKEELVKKIELLCKKGKSNKNSIDQSDINEMFASDDITEEQMENIGRIIENRGIEINPIVDESVLKGMETGVLLGDTDDDIEPIDDELEKEEEENVDLDAVNLLEGIGTEDPVRMYL